MRFSQPDLHPLVLDTLRSAILFRLVSSRLLTIAILFPHLWLVPRSHTVRMIARSLLPPKTAWHL